jgi:2-polyprenyl-6-methoxyphenol hydroxylase-like FAD-dependent oxidoreductase
VAPHASPQIVVLGGGPAGCAAASLLARWGHRVVLRTKPPAESAHLAESIPPSTRKLLDLIGLGEALDAAGVLRSTGNTVWWGGESARIERFADGQRGWQITRACLERVLSTHAASSGVTFEQGRAGAAIPRTFEGDFVLDCTGRAGVLARSRGLRVLESARRTVALTGLWHESHAFHLHDPTHTLIESYEGGWAWSVPEAVNARVIAVMVDPGSSGLARDVSSREVYRREIERTTQMKALVQSATLVDGPSGWDASMYYATRYVDGNALLVGDAASFIDPVSSAGVKKALASGWLAAVAVNTSIRQPSMRDTALDFYQAREAEMYAALKASTDRVLADAASGHAHAFWTDRSEAEPDHMAHPGAAPPLDRLRDEPTLRLARNPAIRIEQRPAVSGTEITLEPRLVTADQPIGIRYAFDVDMIELVDLAPCYGSVPSLFAAYSQHRAPVAFPDFLRALSTAIAQNWLLWV